jgi:transcriptional regulator with XRE-family HTH domain
MPSHIKPLRLNRLPDLMRRELIEARRKRGWSQAELGKRLGMPQMHVSGIETGKIVPRFDTLLDIVRVLDRDLLLVPQALVPAVQALIRDHRSQESGVAAHDGDRPLYASVDEEEDERADEA